MKKKTSAPTLDLHAFKTDDVAAAVDRFLMQASRKNLPCVRIMTGKGSGAVQKKVMEYLRLGGYPYEFEKLESGERNTGVLIVHTG